MKHDQSASMKLLDALPIAVCTLRAPGGEIVDANRAFITLTGHSKAATGEVWCTRGGQPCPPEQTPLGRVVSGRAAVWIDDLAIRGRSGAPIEARLYAEPILTEAGEIDAVVVSVIDADESKASQTQKFESIANLAGGIAHDFNNLLSSIKLVANRMRRAEDDPGKRMGLQQIETAADNAAVLTRELMAFARRGKNLAQCLSLKTVVRNVAELVQRSMDGQVLLVRELCAESCDVLGDVSQLEHLLTSLVVAAKEAMPNGGELTIRTQVLDLDATRAIALKLAPGCYVALDLVDTSAVSDISRGSGILPELKEGVSAGDFWGLAAMMGVIDSHHGAVERIAGEGGASLRLWFPCAPEGSEAIEIVSPDDQVHHGQGMILVVDDQALVREATVMALTDLGYQAMTASDGVEAVEIYAREWRQIDGVILDMLMPRMNGRETYLCMKKINPEVRVLLTTGYAQNEEAQKLLDLGVKAFVAKPCDFAVLSRSLKKILS